MSSTIILIILALAIAGGVGYLKYTKTQQLADEGKILLRKGSYWEYEHLYTTSATYDNLLSAINRTSFADCGADVYPNFNGQASVLFKSNHAWNAVIDNLGLKDGKNQFKFSFVAWETYKGAPYNATSMNILLTTVEKLFLSLDSAVTVQTQRAQIKTKTKLF